MRARVCMCVQRIAKQQGAGITSARAEAPNWLQLPLTPPETAESSVAAKASKVSFARVCPRGLMHPVGIKPLCSTHRNNVVDTLAVCAAAVDALAFLWWDLSRGRLRGA